MITLDTERNTLSPDQFHYQLMLCVFSQVGPTRQAVGPIVGPTRQAVGPTEQKQEEELQQQHPLYVQCEEYQL